MCVCVSKKMDTVIRVQILDGVVEPDRVLSIGQIELNCVLMLN